MKYFLVALLSLLLVSSDSNGQTSARDEEHIKKVLTDFTDAWNKHDAKAFSNVFSEDVEKGASGRNEIEKFHAPGFATKWKDSYQKITQIKIRFIKPDVAAVDAWWELTGIKGPEG